jgi:hypothetical protein
MASAMLGLIRRIAQLLSGGTSVSAISIEPTFNFNFQARAKKTKDCMRVKCKVRYDWRTNKGMVEFLNLKNTLVANCEFFVKPR